MLSFGFSSCTTETLYGYNVILSHVAYWAVLVARLVSCDNLRMDLEGLRSISSDVSSGLLSVSAVGRTVHGAYAMDLFSRNLLTGCRTAFRWRTALFVNCSDNPVFASVVYPSSRNTCWINVRLGITSLPVTDWHSTVHTADNKWCFVFLRICQCYECSVTALPVLP
jgi:hypothetical protein